MKAWYAEHIDDEYVSSTWKHLHTVLFKKVRVPYAADLWRTASDSPLHGDLAEGNAMVASAEFVAPQVQKVIGRREQWLRRNKLHLETLMNNSQKDALLAKRSEQNTMGLQIRSQGRKLTKPRVRTCNLERSNGGIANVSDVQAACRYSTC